MKLLLLTIALTGAAVLLLGIKVFFVKGGSFPNGHAHQLLNRKKQNHK